MNSQTTGKTKNAIIIGGGCAGIAATVKLASAGVHTTLIEKRPFLGGRAFSFYSKGIPHQVDNGQHVFLGACTQYIKLLKIIESYKSVSIQQKLNIPILYNHQLGFLKSPRFVKGRLGNVAALLTYKHINLIDRLRILFALGTMRVLDYNNLSAKYQNMSLYQWLIQTHQNDQTIQKFWEPITIAALNDSTKYVGLAIALMVFRVAFLENSNNATMGYSKVGLSELVQANATKYIKERGGKLITAHSVVRLNFEKDKALVLLSDNRWIEADFIISALPADRLLSILPHKWINSSFFSRAKLIQFAPILAVHLYYDRPVLDKPFMLALDSSAQWIFNVSSIRSEGSQLWHILLSISNAWEWQAVSKADIRSIVTDELKRILPEAKKATVKRIIVIKTNQATFRSLPGNTPGRLPQVTPIPSFFIAGDWTDTGWPSTMEGAVRSGFIAADKAITQHLNSE